MRQFSPMSSCCRLLLLPGDVATSRNTISCGSFLENERVSHQTFEKVTPYHKMRHGKMLKMSVIKSNAILKNVEIPANYLTLSPLDGPYGPMTNTGKDDFLGGLVQNSVNVLMAVFYNSLRFHLSYLTMLPPEKRRIIWVLTVNWK